MTSNRAALTALTLIAGFIALPAFGAISAGTSGLKITTGAPKRPADGMISINTQYRLEGDMTYESTGLVLGLGAAKKVPDTPLSLATQLSDAIMKSMAFQQPEWIGIESKQEKAPDGSPLPEWFLLNKEGFALTRAVFRDYSNAKLTFAPLAGSFADADVQVGIDVVEAVSAINPAEADYQHQVGKEGTSGAGGGITITIGGGEPVQVETKGKTPEEIEKVLAEKLASNGAETGGSPIVPDAEDQTMLRSIAPFDGSEVQFTNLQVQSITVDLNDPSFGVITKFRLKDPGGSASKTISNYLIPLLVVVAFGAYFLKDRFLKKQEGAGA
jgi:hypothetical protein